MRIVVKVGTSTLAHAGGRLNIRRVELMCKVLSDIKNAGHQVILVTSGAIGMGVGKLGLPGRPGDMPGKQAAAAVGQCELMYTYDRLFSQYSHVVAQILLTAEDIRHPLRSSHVHDSLEKLLNWNVLPIINENDVVSTDEIGIQTTIGENDSLSAIVARLVQADLLILLSDIDGLGSGGMATKLRAAKIAMDAGIDMIITNGENPEILYDIFDGKAVGTKFLGKREVTL